MGTFYLLSKKMQQMVWQLKWEQFTPIQEQAIPAIVQTEDDIIISSGTASGKTEAAFLPILSLVESTAKDELNILYVSPLKALINNQFERIEKLCSLSDITVHRWHGDVAQSHKNKLLKEPNGILQITPESIESLFVNRTGYLPNLFGNLRFLVIDEIHAFLDTERGVQLQSLINRIRPFCKHPLRVVGLSATVGDVSQAKRWLCPTNPECVQVITADATGRELLCSLMFFLNDSPMLSLELFEDIRQVTRDQKALIFCNSRGQVEECTVFLNRLAQRDGGGETYFAHHSSIDRKERERVEHVLATTTVPKSVISTSTLELGIDIGNIDLVVQLDSTFTVSSLKQRLGRTGRRPNAPQTLQLYSTTDFSLLQSLAVMQLLMDKWVEPSVGYRQPYDILVHQIISICHQLNGVTTEALLEMITGNSAFQELVPTKVERLIEHLVGTNIVEKVSGRGELIVGLEGERVLRSKDFYSVFMTPEEYHVFHGNREIGRLDKGFVIAEGNNIILAGRLWTIQHIDLHHSKVHVTPAMDGKKPAYFGGGAHLHPRIPETMWEILCSDRDFSYIDDEARTMLFSMRQKYQLHNLAADERAFWAGESAPLFEGFTGTTIGKTLMWMFRAMGAPAKSVDKFGRILFAEQCDIEQLLQNVCEREWTMQGILAQVSDGELFASKFTPFIPPELITSMHAAHEVDIVGAVEFVKAIRPRVL